VQNDITNDGQCRSIAVIKLLTALDLRLFARYYTINDRSTDTELPDERLIQYPQSATGDGSLPVLHGPEFQAFEPRERPAPNSMIERL
jgi:hypothetical protein